MLKILMSVFKRRSDLGAVNHLAGYIHLYLGWTDLSDECYSLVGIYSGDSTAYQFRHFPLTV
ncbi:MAG: hypothetical protein ACR5LD_01970 [Symbiopectobacterium sp.]